MLQKYNAHNREELIPILSNLCREQKLSFDEKTLLHYDFINSDLLFKFCMSCKHIEFITTSIKTNIFIHADNCAIKNHLESYEENSSDNEKD